jgi:hypothetical protein
MLRLGDVPRAQGARRAAGGVHGCKTRAAPDSAKREEQAIAQRAPQRQRVRRKVVGGGWLEFRKHAAQLRNVLRLAMASQFSWMAPPESRRKSLNSIASAPARWAM